MWCFFALDTVVIVCAKLPTKFLLMTLKKKMLMIKIILIKIKYIYLKKIIKTPNTTSKAIKTPNTHIYSIFIVTR